ncbi:CoA-transferase, partial [Kibdelosporangium lantanae]
ELLQVSPAAISGAVRYLTTVNMISREREPGSRRDSYALNPDVAIVHAQRADRKGNVQLWGITGVQKEAVLAAKRSLVTVEEIVDTLEPRPNAVTLPTWVVTMVSEAPRGAHPSYAHDYYVRDNDYYKTWDGISRDRDSFQKWLEEVR